MNPLVANIIDRVKKQLEKDASGHDWYHIERVWNTAKHLQSKEGGDLLTVEIAALLHDISDHKLNGGILNDGGRVAYDLLIQEGCEHKFAQNVAEIVDSVSFKGAEVEDKPASLEAKIVQDADRLDAIGAIGIARVFAFGGAKKQPMYNPDHAPTRHTSFEEYASAKTTSINHFYEKLLLLHERLHTATAKKIGKERHLIMERYLDQFFKEWNSEFE